MNSDGLAEPMFQEDCYDDRLSPFGNELAYKRQVLAARQKQKMVRAALKRMIAKTILEMGRAELHEAGGERVVSKVTRKEDPPKSGLQRVVHGFKEMLT